jgi:hypothetical protein
MTKSAQKRGVFDIHELAKLLDLPEFDDEHVPDAAGAVYDAAIASGATEKEAEQALEDAFIEAERECFSAWKDAVLHVAETLCIEHLLELHELKDGRYRFKPKHTWRLVATQLRMTVNGVGMFYFGSTKEFIECSSGTDREAVLSHLHHLHRWYDVYQGSTSKAAFNRRMVSS